MWGRASGSGRIAFPRHACVHGICGTDVIARHLRGNLAAAAVRGPKDFSELLLTPGVGACTVQVSAMMAEIVHGAPFCFSDSANFSVAHGGKDRHLYAWSDGAGHAGPNGPRYAGRDGPRHDDGNDGGNATASERSDLHDLFSNHDKIKRSVTNLPDGIRTVTESDDSEMAATIKKHVAEMGKRVEEGPWRDGHRSCHSIYL